MPEWNYCKAVHDLNLSLEDITRLTYIIIRHADKQESAAYEQTYKALSFQGKYVADIALGKSEFKNEAAEFLVNHIRKFLDQ